MKEDEEWKKYTKPCVGCGYCCMKTKCGAGARLYPSAETCPALVWSSSNKRYYCNLMELPGKIGEGYREELYAGVGCCSALNDWRLDVKEKIPKKDCLMVNLDPLFQIFLKGLGKEMIGGDTLYFIISHFRMELQNKGTSEYEINELVKLIVYHLKNHRDTSFDSFIGEFDHFNEKKK